MQRRVGNRSIEAQTEYVPYACKFYTFVASFSL